MNLKTIIFVFGALVLLATLASGQSLPYNKLDKLKVNDLVAKKLEVQSTTQSSLPCPSMTQVQRDAITTPTEGSCVYNSDTNVLNIYDGSAWVEVGSGGGGAGGIANWETAKFYEVGDVVIESNKIYQANTQHTSSVFASDIAYWTQIANNVSDVTGVLPMANGGTDKNLTPVLGGVVYTDAGSMEILGAGTTGQFLKSNGAAAPSWEDVVVNDSSFSGLLSLSKGGTNKNLSAEDGAILYLDADSVEKLSPGTSGQVLQSNGAGAPSFANKSISAKSENGSSVTLEEIQVSNNLLTQTDTNKHLIESGNNNILVNPSFEHSTFSTGWTNTNGVFAEDTIVELHGKKAAKVTLTAQALSLHQDSTLYQAQFADGVQGLASVRVKTSVSGIKVCSKQAGIITSNLCVDVQANNKWGLYKVPFILGGTSNGISINSNSTNVTGDVYIDDAFVGAVDLAADVDQSKVAGEAYFAGTSGCSWTRASTTIGPFSTNAVCPGPTISHSTMGQWQTTDTDLPRVTINNLPAGTYKATYYVTSYMTVANPNVLAINDGSTTCEAVQGEVRADQSTTTVSCVFKYSSSGNRSFEVYGASTSSTLNIYNIVSNPRASIKFQLEYFGSGSVYSSTNADTDWQSCGHTTSSFTGFGTVTAIETQCKRQGSDLLMRGKFTTGTVTATEARVSLPVWNGAQLTSAGTSKIQSLQIIGSSARSNVGAANTIFAGIQPSVSYSVFTAIGSPAGTTTLLGTSFGSSETQTMQTLRIPIEGWQNSNIIIGQFNGLESCTNTLECTDTFSAQISSAGVVSNENVNWINGNCSVSTSNFTCTYAQLGLTQPLNCAVSTVQGNTAVIINSSTNTQLVTQTSVVTSTAQVAYTHNVVCQKQGVDYIGKTAKAVASDQNVRSDVAKAVLYSFKVSVSGSVSDEIGDIVNGSCTVASTSNFTCNFNSLKFLSTPNCSVTYDGSGSTYAGRTASVKSTSTSQLNYLTEVSGSLSAAPVQVICHGVSP